MPSPLDGMELGARDGLGDEQGLVVWHQLVGCPVYGQRWGTYGLDRVYGQMGGLFHVIAASGPPLRGEHDSGLGKRSECRKLLRLRQGLDFTLSNVTIRNTIGDGIEVRRANPLNLSKVAIDNSTGAGLYLRADSGVVSVTGCTILGNAVAIANGGAVDNVAIASVTDSVIAGPGYAFANNNAADQGESISIMYSAVARFGPDAVAAVFDPAAPNRGADDPFVISDPSIIAHDPEFVTKTFGAGYLDINSNGYGGKAEGGANLSGYGAYIGASNVDEWRMY